MGTAAEDLATPEDLTGAPLTDLAAADFAHNPAGPWPPNDIIIYNGATGLIDSGPDDAQNIWAVSQDALYLLRPGTGNWVKYTAADGLHIQPFTDPNGNPAVTRITAMTGGAANQVFVGYYGYESDNRLTDTVENMQLGQADKVTLGADGKIAVLKYNFKCDYGNSWCWENRSVRRMVFAHTGTAAGHLFVGMDHGVTHVFNDTFGDHVHVETHYLYADGHKTLKIGEQYGLYVMPNGDLWTGGAYGVGLQPWNPEPHFLWVDGRYKDAFTIYTGNHDLEVPEGYREDNRGIAVTADGTAWFATLRNGLASWNMATPNNYTSVRTDWAAPANLVDIAADNDGTLWLVTLGGELVRFDPTVNGYSVYPGLSGVRRVVMDFTVTPRAMYVSMNSGLAVIRAK
jgi:hypothetical protein